MSRLALLLALVLVGCTRHGNVSICDIVGQPEKYNRSHVTVNGVFLQGRHGAVLADPQCPKSVIALGNERTENQPFQEAVWANYLPNGRVVTASISGTYVFTPAPYPGRLLDRYTVESFQVGQQKPSR